MPISVASSTQWTSDDVWPCLLNILTNYLTHPALDLFGTSDVITPLLSTSPPYKSYYINTRFDGPQRPVRVDAIFFLHNASVGDVELWGTYGRVVVVTDNPRKATPLWVRSRLIDTVVLVPRTLGVDAFTWFPYVPVKCHKPVTLQKTGFCSRNVTWNTDLFPTKVPRTFSDCPVYYKTRPNSPDVIEDVAGVRSGREPAMMDVLAESLKLRAIYRPTTAAFYGWDYANDSVMALLRRGEVDFALAIFVLVSGYTRLAEPLPVFRDQPVMWMLPTPRPKPRSVGIYAGFPLVIWVTIFGVLLVSGAVTVLLVLAERLKWKYWYWLDLVAVVVAAPVSTKPSATISVFILLLQLYSMHIAWFYQSTLLYNLFNTPMERQLTGPFEASMAGLTFLFQEWMMLYFNQSKEEIPLWNRILAHGRFQHIEPGEGLDLIVRDKTAFLLDNSVNVEWIMRQKYRKAASELVFMKPFFTINPITVYGYRGSPLTQRYHMQMLRFIEGGIFWHLSTMQGGYEDLPAKSSSREPQVLQYELLSIAFLMHILICATAIVIFLAELCWTVFRNSRFFPKYQLDYRKFNRPIQLQNWLKGK